jgi:hypothetical protein
MGDIHHMMAEGYILNGQLSINTDTSFCITIHCPTGCILGESFIEALGTCQLTHHCPTGIIQYVTTFSAPQWELPHNTQNIDQFGNLHNINYSPQVCALVLG